MTNERTPLEIILLVLDGTLPAIVSLPFVILGSWNFVYMAWGIGYTINLSALVMYLKLKTNVHKEIIDELNRKTDSLTEESNNVKSHITAKTDELKNCIGILNGAYSAKEKQPEVINKFCSVMDESSKVKPRYTNLVEQILDSTKDEISKLNQEKVQIYNELYYFYLLESAEKCETSLHAINTMPLKKWLKEEEKKWYSANKKARRNGIDVKRIFVIDSLDSVCRPENKEGREIVIEHIADDIKSYLIEKTDTRFSGILNTLLGSYPEGFAIFDNNEVYVDELGAEKTKSQITEQGEIIQNDDKWAGGHIEDKPEEVKAISRLFGLLTPTDDYNAYNKLREKIGEKSLLLEINEIFGNRFKISFDEFKDKKIRGDKILNHYSGEYSSSEEIEYEYKNWETWSKKTEI